MEMDEFAPAAQLIQVDRQLKYAAFPRMQRAPINPEQAEMSEIPIVQPEQPKPAVKATKAAKAKPVAKAARRRGEIPVAPEPVLQAPRLQRADIAPARGLQIADEPPANPTQVFWQIVGAFNWHNRSDGLIGRDHINGVLRQQTATNLRAFKNEYVVEYNRLRDILRADGILARNNINTFGGEAQVISHVIALGHDQYVTLSLDMEILQFLIESNECISLNELLPAELAL
jgi:hypothetical protein